MQFTVPGTGGQGLNLGGGFSLDFLFAVGVRVGGWAIG